MVSDRTRPGRSKFRKFSDRSWGHLQPDRSNSINIYTVAGASDFKFGTQLGFAKAHHKTTPRGKVGVAFG